MHGALFLRIRLGCLWAVLLLVGLVVLAVAVVAVQARRTPAGTPEYVALGSSFAAGADLGPLQRGSPLLCARSVNGYPQQLARRLDLSIIDMSCGGAVTRHVLKGGQFFQRAQIRAVTPQTRLVTLTVGGNDIGYVGDLSLLAARKDASPFGWLVRTFWRGPEPAAGRAYDTLGDELLATIRAVKARSPQAVVAVAAYPALLPEEGTCDALGLSPSEAALMRDVGDRLAATTEAAARAGGAIYVDMNRLGQAHDPCSPEPWTRGWKKAGAAPFHPTLRGAEATAEQIAMALTHVSGFAQP
ncbi:MAG: SGNH/GDSL hydrolase family protein [Bordetella sp.]|nr:SGNH/GDSL hydrolase family protein [Bordetella sp.]